MREHNGETGGQTHPKHWIQENKMCGHPNTTGTLEVKKKGKMVRTSLIWALCKICPTRVLTTDPLIGESGVGKAERNPQQGRQKSTTTGKSQMSETVCRANMGQFGNHFLSGFSPWTQSSSQPRVIWTEENQPLNRSGVDKAKDPPG